MLWCFRFWLLSGLAVTWEVIGRPVTCYHAHGFYFTVTHSQLCPLEYVLSFLLLFPGILPVQLTQIIRSSERSVDLKPHSDLRRPEIIFSLYHDPKCVLRWRMLEIIVRYLGAFESLDTWMTSQWLSITGLVSLWLLHGSFDAKNICTRRPPRHPLLEYLRYSPTTHARRGFDRLRRKACLNYLVVRDPVTALLKCTAMNLSEWPSSWSGILILNVFRAI